MASTEHQATWTTIIDDILAASDLNTISAKRIRKGLQERLDYDISDQKAAITDLIMERFDKFSNAPLASASASAEPPTINGATNHVKKETSASVEPKATSTSPSPSSKRKASAVDSDDLSDPIDDPSPPKKAKRAPPSRGEAEDDAAYARRLQAELDALARPTRGGTTRRKAAPARKSAPSKPKKSKSKAKLNASDDSSLASGSETTPKPKKTGGFNKPMSLSDPLSDLLGGATALSRPQTVKQIWAYVKERDLQDPSDKRQIRCDEKMRAVFKSERVHMFTMNKVLKHHLFPLEEAQEEGVGPREDEKAGVVTEGEGEGGGSEGS